MAHNFSMVRTKVSSPISFKFEALFEYMSVFVVKFSIDRGPRQISQQQILLFFICNIF